jgi:hypothetical protein
VPFRRPASPAVVVVLSAVGALLASSAGTAAYLGMSHFLQGQPVADPGATATRTTSTGPTLTPSPTAAPSPTGQQCPPYTVAAVRKAGGPGELSMLLHVEGTYPGLNDAEAWICQDSDGTLYYQGHDKDGKQPDPATNTILIGGTVVGHVNFVPASSSYVAINPGKPGEGTTTYRVSSTEFVVLHPDGSTTKFTITKVVPPQL